ncbi:CRE-SRH-89 protein [Caenorhabditis remanei]|uniref:CRE-SRH-89 protein n=1 Tax=Caenorhabditis remanei TaxID=31234 RepID=E3LKX9_CAERE|nr:CRE-SRH-89 protein [Caenorhabditis remanei]
MAKTLAEYYAIDYPKCTIDNSFLASWEGLAYPCRVIQCIASPIQLLTGWFIMKKTPMMMNSVKVPLLIFHIFCSIQDFHVLSLANPYVFLPSYALFGVGLFSWIGIPVTAQMIAMALSIFCNFLYLNISVITHLSSFSGTGAAMTFLFESRASVIPNNKFKLTKNGTRIKYYFGNVIFNSVTSLFFVTRVPENQEREKLEILKIIPCPAAEFFSESTFVFLDSYYADIVIVYVVPIFLILALSQFLFFAFCSVYYLFISPTSEVSPQTRRLQRGFFIGIVFQTLIPFAVMALPYIVLTVALKHDKLTQGLTNIYFMVYGMHGLMESIAIIMVHRHYRRILFGFFKLENKVKPSESDLVRK